VLVLSVAALTAALATGGLLEERTTSTSSPSPSASRAPVELSRAGRIAYWRPDPSSGNQLWVSNLDGSGRHPIATIDLISRVSLTRWSPDGSSVAYADRSQAVVVQRLDGLRSELPLPTALASGGFRLIDLSWSTDSRLLAATVRDAGSQFTDVYVAAAEGAAWRNVTGLRNALLAQWISADELLIQTQVGLIGIINADGSRLRPLTGLVATSPFVGDDGRIYFLAGQVAPTLRDQTVPVMNASQARVWSMTIDGEDVRLEVPQRYDDVRLVARWSPGRFLVHQGASTALAFLNTGLPPLETVPGVVDRVVFSPDRRTAIGLTASRISRYDTTQPDRPVVLLSDVTQPDAWYPVTTPSARASPVPSPPVRPAARYTFALGGLIWATDATGTVRLLRQLQSDDRTLRRLSGVAIPQWSPKGDRIVYFDVLANSFRGAVFITDATGTGRQLSDLDAAGPFPTWSPDGNVAYTDLLFSLDSAGLGAAGEVRVVSPSNVRVATFRAREIAFGGGKTYLIDNGRLALPAGNVDNVVLEQAATGTRTVTNAAFLNAGLPFVDVPGGSSQTSFQLSMLGASADGAFLSARISPATGTTGPFTFVIFSAGDGRPTTRLEGQGVADVAWAPSGHLVGMTLGGNIATVRDAQSGAVVALGPPASSSRFAGWSPDGKWFYVARDDGLYAQPLAGGDAVRISALGVPVSTTTTQ